MIYAHNILEDSEDIIEKSMNKYEDYDPVSAGDLPFTNVLTVSPEEKGGVCQKKICHIPEHGYCGGFRRYAFPFAK